MGTPVHRIGHAVPASATLLRGLYVCLAAACSDLPSPPLPPPPPATTQKAVIVLNVITTGSAPDSNGYRLVLDQENHGQLAPSSEVELTVDPGTHTLLLADLAGNCRVTQNNPRQVVVGSGGRIFVTFQLWCPLLGALDVSTTTSGVSPDPDGYVLSLDGVVKGTLGLQDQFRLDSIPPGVYLVRLSSVAGNCSAMGGSSKWTSVEEGAKVALSFEITCVPRVDDTPGEKLVVQAVEYPDPESSLYLLNADGSARQRLTDDLVYALAPAFSPDGSRILFVRSAGGTNSLAIMDRASRAETVLPTRDVSQAVWSPDGAGIAFARDGRIFRMSSDGTREAQLTNGSDDRDPNWSPDGTRIAFTRGNGVYLMNADGTLQHSIGVDMRAAGPWSTDGRRLVVTMLEAQECYYYYYASGCGTRSTDLAILDVQTGEEKQVTQTPMWSKWSPAWATDGLSLYFISAPAGNSDVFRVRLDGSAPVDLTNSAAREDWVSVGYVSGSASTLKIRRP